MTKLLIAFLFSFNNLATTPDMNANLSKATSEAETYVYICNSNGAKKYHYTKSCRGLNACKHEIKKVSLSDAKYDYKRTLCGWED